MLGVVSKILGVATPLLGHVFDFTGAPTPYEHAGFRYNRVDTFFDNEFGTWGTDYGLALVMLCGVIALRSLEHARKSQNGPAQPPSPDRIVLARSSKALIAMYAVSVLTGAIAHQCFINVDMLNTPHFRTLWTVCVGTVATAGGAMGCAAAALVRLQEPPPLGATPHLGQAVLAAFSSYRAWAMYGVVMLGVALVGGFSMKLPASDIFLAGVTQTPPTMYIAAVLLWGRWPPQVAAARAARWGLVASHLANCPLIFVYPWLLDDRRWSPVLTLEQVNVACHANLLVCWGGQCVGLYAVAKVIDACHRTKSA